METSDHVFPWEIEEPEGSRNSWSEYGRLLADAVLNNKELPTANCKDGRLVSSRKPTKESSPDAVVHLNDEGINKAAVVEAVSSFIRLTEDEKSLLLYYSTCSSGFKPALKTIIDKTGLSKSQICRSKNRLIEKNILDWQSADEFVAVFCDLNKYTDRIVIDWLNLFDVAVVSAKRPECNNNHCYRNAEGKPVHQHITKHLGPFENRLLWNNKPASYWARQAIKYRNQKCQGNKNSILDYTSPLTDTISLSQEELNEARASVLKTVQDNLVRHQVSQNLIRLQLIDWNLQEYQEYPLPF